MKIAPMLLLIALVALAPACGGYGPTTPAAAQPGVIPAIMALEPPSAKAGGSAFILTVNGSGFSSTSTVNFNGKGRSITFVTANQITTAITAADIATPGTVSVSVTNPGMAGTGQYGGGGTMSETSNSMTFTIN